jgi:hypothetical protein
MNSRRRTSVPILVPGEPSANEVVAKWHCFCLRDASCARCLHLALLCRCSDWPDVSCRGKQTCRPPRPGPHHSASRARTIAGLFGFLTLIQSHDGPDR